MQRASKEAKTDWLIEFGMFSFIYFLLGFLFVFDFLSRCE